MQNSRLIMYAATLAALSAESLPLRQPIKRNGKRYKAPKPKTNVGRNSKKYFIKGCRP